MPAGRRRPGWSAPARPGPRSGRAGRRAAGRGRAAPDRPRAGAEDYGLVKAARAALGKAEARAAAQAARAARTGRGPVRNITDPDSRLMPLRGGFIQGYNPQNVTSADGLIIATELTRDTTDTQWFEPMLAPPWTPPR